MVFWDYEIVQTIRVNRNRKLRPPYLYRLYNAAGGLTGAYIVALTTYGSLHFYL